MKRALPAASLIAFVSAVVGGMLAVSSIAAAAANAPRDPSQAPAPTPVATPAVVIDAPADGSVTPERTATVRGYAPRASRGGAVAITVLVNRRHTIVPHERGGRFAVPVTLSLGENTIAVTAEISSDQDGEPETTLSSPPIELTRTAGPHTGELDRATALWVAKDHSDVYWLCGESADCYADPVCLTVSPRRVDCPVQTQYQPGEPVVCGVVISVQLRGLHVHSYSYGCHGRWRAAGWFVRTGATHMGRRYRVDEKSYPWLSDEVNDPNPYGVPRFDVERDEFIP